MSTGQRLFPGLNMNALNTTISDEHLTLSNKLLIKKRHLPVRRDRLLFKGSLCPSSLKTWFYFTVFTFYT